MHVYTGFLLGFGDGIRDFGRMGAQEISVSVMFSVMVTPLSVLLLELSELSLELSP